MKIFCAIFALILLGLLSGCAGALFSAAEKGDVKTIKVLLDEGADVNESSPLMIASYKGHIEVVKMLLDRGANVNAVEVPGGWTPLSYAARNGQYEIVTLLLEKGADVNRAIRLVKDNMWAKEAIKVLEEFKERNIANQPPRHGASPPMLPTALPLPTESNAPF